MSPQAGANDLLAALPLAELERVMSHGVRVALAREEILGHAGEPAAHVHFPLEGFAVVLAAVERHDAMAVALVGSEGMIGTSVVLGGDRCEQDVRVLAGGSALRIGVQDFRAILAVSPALDRQLRGYVRARLLQASQIVACTAFHRVETRLACWLLLAHDRAHRDRFFLTHDTLSAMLGVRRSGVTRAAGALHAGGYINYSRGHIAVTNRRGLEHAACECYAVMHDATEQALASGVGEDVAEIFGSAAAAAHASERRELPARGGAQN